MCLRVLKESNKSRFDRYSRQKQRATHEGNKSRNHELKADKRLIFTYARIPQGMQKYIHY